jgi:hypothetical protein
MLDFKRPIPRWSVLQPSLKAFLDEFVTNNTPRRERCRIAPNVELEVFPRARPSSATFTVAITADDDSGGWVIPELERNLRLCIDEKTAKVAAYRSKYSEWWLLFIDLFAFGLDQFDRQQFKQRVQIEHAWDRIIIVNPANPSDYFTI